MCGKIKSKKIEQLIDCCFLRNKEYKNNLVLELFIKHFAFRTIAVRKKLIDACETQVHICYAYCVSK